MNLGFVKCPRRTSKDPRKDLKKTNRNAEKSHFFEEKQQQKQKNQATILKKQVREKQKKRQIQNTFICGCFYVFSFIFFSCISSFLFSSFFTS